MTARKVTRDHEKDLRRATENNVVIQGTRSQRLPCGHYPKGLPVSETRTYAYYRCSAGCELQRVRRSAL